MPLLELSFESGEDSLSVRHFSVQEGLSTLFAIEVTALSPSDDVDLASIVGHRASFQIHSRVAHALDGTRRWTGVCSHMELVQVEPTGLSTYLVRIEPRLWLLTQRINHRTFQLMSVPEIVERILEDWHIKPSWRIDRKDYSDVETRIQYGESDFSFMSRLLEEAGITFLFHDEDDEPTRLVFHDRPQARVAREGPPIPYVDNPSGAAEREYVTNLRLAHDIRPGRLTIRGHDFRRPPGAPLVGEASSATGIEGSLEHYEFASGAFAAKVVKESDTPVADDRGAVRYEAKVGKLFAERSLEAMRATRRVVSFDTNALDLAPGVIFSVSHHTHRELAPDKRLLVTELFISGDAEDDWEVSAEAVFASHPYRPLRVTSKPKIYGVQSAIVVGPKGEEIHTDEFGRVRVQFHWDREGKYDHHSSPWVRVSYGWAGSGFGMIMIPRVGQEVIVGFLDGDPDQPVVVGRLYNNTSRVPYKLPKNKTVSAWRSASTPGSAGFNEIKFDDAKGKELVAMHAERDLRKLVKRNERETTGRRRTIKVGNRLTLTTGKASIILDGPNITMQAKGCIKIRSTRKDVFIDGSPRVRINQRRRKKIKQEGVGGGTAVAGYGTERYAQGVEIRGSEAFRAKVRASLDGLRKTAAGRGLLRKIARSGRTVKLNETTARNAFALANNMEHANRRPDGRFGMGTGSTLYFNPNYKPDGASSEVVLGNLLIHGWHNAAGRRDPGMLPSGVRNEDLRTIGLPPYSMRSPTENSLRRELKQPPRTKY